MEDQTEQAAALLDDRDDALLLKVLHSLPNVDSFVGIIIDACRCAIEP